MPKGGARAGSGPAPDPRALRRDRKDDAATWVTLPAHRTGAVPAWPLSKATVRETAVWRKEWKRPQAVMWERNGQELEVALYVRTFVEAETRMATAALRTLVKQQMNDLGLTESGLRKYRWKIATDEVAPRRETAAKKAAATKRASSRSRLKVVTGAGGE